MICVIDHNNSYKATITLVFMIQTPFYDAEGIAAREGIYRTDKRTYVYFTGKYKGVAGKRKAQLTFATESTPEVEELVGELDFEKLIRIEMRGLLLGLGKAGEEIDRVARIESANDRFFRNSLSRVYDTPGGTTYVW